MEKKNLTKVKTVNSKLSSRFISFAKHYLIQKRLSREFNITYPASMQYSVFVTTHDHSRFQASNFAAQIDPQYFILNKMLCWFFGRK